MYSYCVEYYDAEYERTGHRKEVKRLKGLKKNVVDREIGMQDYRSMVRSMDQVDVDLRHAQIMLRSRRHIITTDRLVKRSLSSYDDKRYLLPCGVHTLAYGNACLSDGSLEDGCPFCADSLSGEPYLPK